MNLASLLIISCAFIWCSSAVPENITLVSLTSGLKLETVNAYPYESFVPLVYHVPIPSVKDWIDWSDGFNDTRYPKIFSVTRNLLFKMRPTPRHRSSRDSAGLFPFLGKIYNFLYGTATQESYDIVHTNQVHLDNFTRAIEQQVLQQQKFTIKETRIIDNHFTELENAIREIRTTETNDVNKIQEETEIIGDELFFATLEGRQEIIGLAFATAVAACDRGMLSRFFVTEETLHHDIRALSDQLRFKSQVLAIPADEYRKYFTTAGLTHCTFSDTRAALTVRVPVRPLQHKYQVFSVMTTPFLYNNIICQLDINTKYVVTRSDEVLPISPWLEDQCPISRNGLCRVPPYDVPYIFEQNCLDEILSNAPVESLRQSCHYKCTPYRRPVVFLSSGHHVYVIAPHLQVTINCKNQDPKIIMTPSIGHLRIALPCGCFLEIKNKTYFPEYPCPADLKSLHFEHSIPGTLTTLDEFIITNNSHFAATHKIIDHAWHTKVSHVNLTVPPLPTATPWELIHLHVTSYTSYVTAIIVAIIAVLVLIVLYRSFCLATPLALIHGAHASPLNLITTTCDVIQLFLLLGIIVILLVWFHRRFYRTHPQDAPRPAQIRPQNNQVSMPMPPSTFNWSP